MNKIRTLTIFILSQISITTFTQELVTPLVYNPNQESSSFQSKRKSALGAIDLPFIDDFSYASNVSVPDLKYWSNSLVYINTRYTNNPISIGVATFDALDETGNLYKNAINKNFRADSLVSQEINLDYTPKDSIYLSFYYQQGGLAEIPDKADSLCLAFWAPVQKKWHLVFTAKADSTKSFKIAMVAINDTAYLHSGFRFMIFNYASLNIKNNALGKNSNGDIWNIDYVYLNTNRYASDTIIKDVAIMLPVKSFLANFESMPWNHFKLPTVYQNEMAAIAKLKVVNHGYDSSSINHVYQIHDVFKNVDFEPIEQNTMKMLLNVALTFEADIPVLISDMEDSATFLIKAYLSNTLAGDRKENDTSVYNQVFKNYYAYDDGSAEYGYGLYGEGTSNAQVALKFKTAKEDSLQAVDIYFNHSIKDENINDFHLCVWGIKNGVLDSLYKSEPLKPLYENELNKFHRYFLEKPILVPATFYVGWQQTNENFLNFGLDINRTLPASSEILVNYQGTPKGWETSKQRNVPMIRAVVGSYKDAFAEVSQPTKMQSLSLSVYPNPANDFVNIKLSETTDEPVNIRIFDISGKQVMNSNNIHNSLNISNLNEGLYLIQVITNNGHSVRGKFVKSLK